MASSFEEKLDTLDSTSTIKDLLAIPNKRNVGEAVVVTVTQLLESGLAMPGKHRDMYINDPKAIHSIDIRQREAKLQTSLTNLRIELESLGFTLLKVDGLARFEIDILVENWQNICSNNLQNTHEQDLESIANCLEESFVIMPINTMIVNLYPQIPLDFVKALQTVFAFEEQYAHSLAQSCLYLTKTTTGRFSRPMNIDILAYYITYYHVNTTPVFGPDIVTNKAKFENNFAKLLGKSLLRKKV